MNTMQLYLFLSNHMGHDYDVFVEGSGTRIESIQFIEEARCDRDNTGEYILIKLGE
jgi:hypothetical protein